jgi:hypothetical protein
MNQRWTGWFYITKEEWDLLSKKYRITMCFEELDLMQEIRSRPYQSERDTISKELALELCMDAMEYARGKVLDKLVTDFKDYFDSEHPIPIDSKVGLKVWIAELHQQAGEP